MQVGKGAGMGWLFTPPEKPAPVVWVSQGFMGSQLVFKSPVKSGYWVTNMVTKTITG